jgi:hypothetical protein
VNRVSTEDVLNKAYRLAYFLHQDNGVAMRIVAAATLKLNVAMAVQSKRLYYVPVGRFSRGELRRTDGIRNKTLFSDLHLLQRLVYVESEPYERQKERAAQSTPPGVPAVGDPATEDDLLVYFTKHLVRITTKRNAFYVTLGVSRLLHSYSTLETMELYNAVIGEPERVKDDYYYRSRKAVLMQELSKRFGQLIRACRRQRGEERFETQQGSSEQRSLMRECLRLFTPWDTQCPVPRDFDPFNSVIASLTSNGSADENRLDVNRIHAILHPDCFTRLVAAFGYDPPEERMELPRFFFEQEDDQSPPRQRSAPSDLSSEEVAEINDMLAEQSRRRRRSSSTGVIRIMVDGIERGRLNPAERSSISFSAGEDSELVEVKTTDAGGDLLLATHLLTSFAEDARDKATVYSIRLEGGQELSLSIIRRRFDTNGDADLLVKFGYQETAPRRAARLWWQRLKGRFSASSHGFEGLTARHVLAASVLVICVAGFLGYVTLRSRQTSGPAQTSVVQTNAPNVVPTPVGQDQSNSGGSSNTTSDLPATVKAPEPERPASQRPRVKSNSSVAVKAPSTDNRSPRANSPSQVGAENVAEDVTRSGNVVANLTLKEVKKIYIDMRGDVALNDLRRDIVAGLSSSGVVAATTNADEADASLKIVVSQTGSQVKASVQLVNARGTMLWPKAGRGARRYSGEVSKVMSEVIKDLLSEIRLAR